MPTSVTPRPWIYLGGTFDTFHPGHVNLLRRASVYGHVVVALNTDEFAARYKRRPVMTLAERLIVVGACRYVTVVTINEGDEDSKPTIARWRPKFIGHGDDWKGDSLMQQMGLTPLWLKRHSIEMVELPYTKGISSTDVRERLCVTP